MKNIAGFDWDEGNKDKNWNTHQVDFSEYEEVFFNIPLLLDDDVKHSQLESRYFVLGQTNQMRKLFMVFTIRNSKIRVISARDMNKTERKTYEKEYSKIQ